MLHLESDLTRQKGKRISEMLEYDQIELEAWCLIFCANVCSCTLPCSLFSFFIGAEKEELREFHLLHQGRIGNKRWVQGLKKEKWRKRRKNEKEDNLGYKKVQGSGYRYIGQLLLKNSYILTIKHKYCQQEHVKVVTIMHQKW